MIRAGLALLFAVLVAVPFATQPALIGLRASAAASRSDLVRPAAAQAPAGRPDPAAAVFLLINYDRRPGPDGQFGHHMMGTGFFIAPDGTALTASHVVYPAAMHPDKYRLLAIVGGSSTMPQSYARAGCPTIPCGATPIGSVCGPPATLPK